MEKSVNRLVIAVVGLMCFVAAGVIYRVSEGLHNERKGL